MKPGDEVEVRLIGGALRGRVLERVERAVQPGEEEEPLVYTVQVPLRALPSGELDLLVLHGLPAALVFPWAGKP